MTGNHLEGNPGSWLDRTASISDLRAVEPVAPAIGGNHLAETGSVVEAVDRSCARGDSGHDQCTIFEMGSSMMSVAPRSDRAGINVLMVDLGTTVSTA